MEPTLRFAGTVVNTPDPDGLASFYERLLGWPRLMDEPDWIALRHPDGGTAVAFQRDPAAVRPAWPAEPGRQQMLLHLDFVTADLDAAVEHAVDCGAAVADTQSAETERVLFDPVGNPFCIILSNS
ncbi:MAG: VOC family protein [Ilumatobacter sp.]|nr:VOC family protein [Ilumatobacter sp.]